LKATISYDKEIRIETYIPVQIRIEEDEMYISNDCVFPHGWTAETLMQRHRSEQYNPDIANAFFGQDMWKHGGGGFKKICESCEDNGNIMPEYILHPGDIMVKFTAISKEQDDALENLIISRLRKNSKLKQSELADDLGVSRRSVQRSMKKLSEQGKIERKGSKRSGYWKVHDSI